MQEWMLPFYLCAVKESALPLLAMGKLYKVKYGNPKRGRALYSSSVLLLLLLAEGLSEACPSPVTGYLLGGAEILVILVLTVLFMEGCKEKNARLYLQAILIRQSLEEISVSLCVGIYGQAAARRLAETSGFWGGIGLAWAAVYLTEKIKIEKLMNYAFFAGITMLCISVKQVIAGSMEIDRVILQAAGYLGGLAPVFLLLFIMERRCRKLKGLRDKLALQVRNSREYYGSFTELKRNWEEQTVKKTSQKAWKDLPESTSYLKQLEEQAAHLNTIVCSGNLAADAVLHQKKKKAEQMGIMFQIQGNISRRSPLNGEEWLLLLEEMLEFGLKHTKPDVSASLWLLIEEQAGFEMLSLEITSKLSNGCPKLKELKAGKRITAKYQGRVQIVPGDTIRVQAMFQLKQFV